MEKNKLLQKRMEMLKKRSEMLKEMDIQSTITSLKPTKKPRKKRAPVVVDESQRRKSRRILGLQPELTTPFDEMPQEASEPREETVKTVIHKDFADAYKNTDFSGISIPIHVDGSFRGWVDPEVCKRHGIGEEEQSAEPIAETAEDENKAIKKRRSQHPSSAKERSRKCLHSNPNSYFYRHVEPGLEQWGGDWKEEPSVSPPSSLDAATSGVSFPRTFRIAWGTRCHFRSGIIPSVPTSTDSTSFLVDSLSTLITPLLLMARPFSSDALYLFIATYFVFAHCHHLKISSYAC
ncbi:hypothetical protein BLSTO_03377 [Blastocystis sp. subtype 1]